MARNPSAFYATEIAAREGFINSVVMQLLSVVSRKTHGRAGSFDIELPQTARPGIECRSGGATNDYMVVFTFANNISVTAASVTSGVGSVSSFSVAGDQVTVNLTGVTNAQTIVVTLADVNNGTNTSSVQVTMGVLLGDVNASGNVDSADVGLVQRQNNQPVTSSNFRMDVDASGNIDSADVGITQRQNQQHLP
jgi:hypothetical protein